MRVAVGEKTEKGDIPRKVPRVNPRVKRVFSTFNTAEFPRSNKYGFNELNCTFGARANQDPRRAVKPPTVTLELLPVGTGLQTASAC